jgi:aspartate aminotransferase
MAVLLTHMDTISRTIASLQQQLHPLLEFLNNSTHAKRQGDPRICDFVFGNPHEMPLDGVVDAIRRHAIPRNQDWFAYTVQVRDAARKVADGLATRCGLPFAADDIRFATGTFGALAASLRAVTDPGDEVIFLSPPWFFYESMIAALGAVPVRVVLQAPHFDLDAEAVGQAVTPRTRAIIVNSPHNPTGRIYSRAALDRLAEVLTQAAARHGRPIVLLSDESYSRVLFDGRAFVSPAAAYPHTLIQYTYGKQLLAPGERVGYIAVSPHMDQREEMRAAILFAQIVGGWQIPSATLQRAVVDFEGLSIDISAIERRRNRMARALVSTGYDVMMPDATFYMMVKSPLADDGAFCRLLERHDIFVGPGALFEMPGYFRISLTANDDMVERSLAGFAAAIEGA